MTTARERFAVMLASAPMLRGDAIVVLAGEDGYARCDVAEELFKQSAAPLIVLSGALDTQPRYQGATRLAKRLIGRGIDPERLLVDDKAQHTRDNAVNVVKMATTVGWKRLLVIASPYHTVRAYLTFLKALQEVGKDRDVHIVMVPASQVKWSEKPAGVESPRVDLLAAEYAKVEQYRDHVASYDEAIDYLLHWEKAA